MNREEFMKELEYLLSDIPDEEKAEAIGYYRDYLEEAGEENEEAAIREFGSPERIAAIIRSDLSGHLEDGGEFTDKGYEDERFRDPNYQVAKRYDLPDAVEGQKTEERGRKERESAENQPYGEAYPVDYLNHCGGSCSVWNRRRTGRNVRRPLRTSGSGSGGCGRPYSCAVYLRDCTADCGNRIDGDSSAKRSSDDWHFRTDAGICLCVPGFMRSVLW